MQGFTCLHGVRSPYCTTAILYSACTPIFSDLRALRFKVFMGISFLINIYEMGCTLNAVKMILYAQAAHYFIHLILSLAQDSLFCLSAQVQGGTRLLWNQQWHFRAANVSGLERSGRHGNNCWITTNNLNQVVTFASTASILLIFMLVNLLHQRKIWRFLS